MRHVRTFRGSGSPADVLDIVIDQMPRPRFGSFVVAVRLVFGGACDRPERPVGHWSGLRSPGPSACFGFGEGGLQPALRALLCVLAEVAILALLAVAIVDRARAHHAP
jgi:hypothetical protein